MEIFELVIRLTTGIAWPLTVLVIFLVLRKRLLLLLPLLRRLKAGPVEAEFEKEVQEISEEQGWRLPSPESSPKAKTRRDELLQLAQINPRAAVMDAWQGIEFSLRRAVLQRLGGSSPPPSISSPISMIRELAREGGLDASDVSLLHELRGLRNQATHLPDFSLTFEAAQNYADLAVRLQQKLDTLAQMNPEPRAV